MIDVEFFVVGCSTVYRCHWRYQYHLKWRFNYIVLWNVEIGIVFHTFLFGLGLDETGEKSTVFTRFWNVWKLHFRTFLHGWKKNLWKTARHLEISSDCFSYGFPILLWRILETVPIAVLNMNKKDFWHITLFLNEDKESENREAILSCSF